MKRLIAAVTISMSCGVAIAQQNVDVQRLIDKAEKLNSECRDGSGDQQKTDRKCSERDKVIDLLSAKGWCYGHEGQAGYERKWERCHQSMPETVSIYLPNKGKTNDVLSLDRASLVVYVERRCNFTELPFYRNMKYATMSGVPVCAFKQEDTIYVVSPSAPGGEFPDVLFALARVDGESNTATVIQPNFDSTKAQELYMQREREKIRSQLIGAPKPPREFR